jgi:DME family drug/metabolite transporter
MGARRAASPGLRRGALKVFTAAAALGTLGPVAGLAYQEGVTPPAFSALRAAIGAGILGALVLTRRQPSIRLSSLAPRERTLLALAVAVNGVMNLVLFLAFGAMTVALVMVIFYTYPVLVAAGSVALGRERLTPARIAALAVAGVGLALILGSQVGPEAHATVAGLALAGVAAVCHAVYLIVVRDGFSSVPSVQATSLVLAGGLVISGAAALLVSGSGVVGAWVQSPVAWAAILFAGTFGAALPKVWVISGVRVIGSTRAAVLMLMEPVVAVVVAALALGQGMTAPELLGGAAILLAVLIVQRPDPAAELACSVSAETAAPWARAPGPDGRRGRGPGAAGKR